MFPVKFFNFQKKPNSTARPADAGTEIQCILKEPCSIQNPVITLDLGMDAAPVYNYCYIAIFSRWYYVTDWIFTENRMWQASLSSDLLATFKSDIGNAQLYILRCSAESDGNIADTYYPAKTFSVFGTRTVNNPWVNNVQDGSFVIGVGSGDTPTYGSTTYYLMDPSQCMAMMRDLANNFVTELNGFSLTDASLALQKALIDPFQYINSCIWFPIPYGNMPGVGSLHSLSLGGFDLPTASGRYINAASPDTAVTFSFELPAHPFAETRGAYMTALYRKLYLEIPPFGSVEIDNSVAALYSRLAVRINIDTTSGKASIRIGCGNDGDTISTLLARYESQIGVPMQLSAVYRDTFNSLGGLLSGGIRTAASLFGGSIFGAVGSAVAGVTDAANNSRPRVESIGSAGSFSGFTGAPTLYIQFLDVVNEDNAHSGRPLCAIRQISTIPGYIMVKDGDIEIDGFTGEAETIKSIMETGFFYE